MEALPVDAAISEDTPSTSTQQGECARGLRRIFESHVHPPYIYCTFHCVHPLHTFVFSLAVTTRRQCVAVFETALTATCVSSQQHPSPVRTALLLDKETVANCILLLYKCYLQTRLPSLWQNQRGRSGFQTGERFVAYLSKTLLVFFTQFHSTFYEASSQNTYTHGNAPRTCTFAHSHIRHTRPQTRTRAHALLIDAHSILLSSYPPSFFQGPIFVACGCDKMLQHG